MAVGHGERVCVCGGGGSEISPPLERVSPSPLGLKESYPPLQRFLNFIRNVVSRGRKWGGESK